MTDQLDGNRRDRAHLDKNVSAMLVANQVGEGTQTE